MTKICFLFVTVHLIWAVIVSASVQRNPDRNPYSLQPAIDLLHRREAQLALRDYEKAHHEEGSNPKYASVSLVPLEHREPELDKQRQINQLLAKYLEQDEENEEHEDDDFYDDNEPDPRTWYNTSPDEEKRSVFRERDGDEADQSNPNQSVFRERELESSSGLPANIGYYGNNPRSELAEDFVREIDQERKREREQLYREDLQRLLSKYEQQEEDTIEREILADELQRNAILEGAILQQELKNRNNHHRSNLQWEASTAEKEIEKRRLTLPWLPARRKRFPISKRSSTIEAKRDADPANAKISQDLQTLFGEPNIESSNRFDIHKVAKKSDRSLDLKHNAHRNHGMQNDEPHHHQHRNADHSHEHGLHEHSSHEHGSHEDHSHEEHDHEEHEGEDSEEEEDDDDRKKKRSAATTVEPKPNITGLNSNPEELKLDQLISSSASRPVGLSAYDEIAKLSKKSIQWSKYFGLDRKKKLVDDWYMPPYRSHPAVQEALQSEEDDLDEHHVSDELTNEKIDNIERKLQAIERHIIDSTMKYTGAHDRFSDPKELEEFQNRIISRIATAYSLDKMRRALHKLKVVHALAKPYEQTGSKSIYELNDQKSIEKDKDKRVAVKKEKVVFDNNHHTIDSVTEGSLRKVSDSSDNNGFEGAPTSAEQDDKKKKRNDAKPVVVLNPGNEDGSEPVKYATEYFAGNYRNGMQNFNECPMLDAIEQRCESVDLLGGGGGRNLFERDALLPACTLHQFCYLCGTSQTFCDYQYLSDSENICGINKDCQSTAHLVLMILRGSSTGPSQVGPKECAKNPCLLQAMKNIAGY